MQEVQELALKLMELGSFNNFNGKATSNFLKDNSHMWKTAWFGTPNTGLILRDIEDNIYHGDTLYVIVKNDFKEVFKEYLQEKLRPDECWYEKQPQDFLGSYVGKAEHVLLAWWD